ncbi:MAG TPA: hypothetical protein VN607_08845 [Gemmatimonadaceae bacterium]|nr:hypothetical protein [Gemmatimonadaceae bacterium]
MVIIPYFPIRDENLKRIIKLKLAKIQRRLTETHRVTMTFDDALVSQVAERCTEVESGARNVDNILTNTLLPEISREILERMAAGDRMSAIKVGVQPDGTFDYQVTGAAAAPAPAAEPVAVA